MDNQPLVSVGIPTYNRPQGVRRTLTCMAQQTYKNLEIIVSDNCSPDPEVEKVIKEFKEKDSRVQFFQQSENMGAINNFKFVLEKATGEYFMWAADDDEWELDFIEKNLHLIQADARYIASFSNFYEVDVNGKRIAKYPEHLPFLKQISNFDKYQRLQNFIAQHEKNGKANLFYSLIKIDIVKKIFTNFSYFNLCAADDLFVLSWLCEGNIAIVNNVLYRPVAGNQKFLLASNKPTKKNINLLILKIDINVINYTLNGWFKYLCAHFKIIRKSDLTFFKKMKLYNLVTFRIFLLLYDIVTFSFSTPFFNLFSILRRKNCLVNITNSNE